MARKTDEERFWRQVTKGGPDECWTWTGCTQRGYGLFGAEGKSNLAYRWLYLRVVGPLPKGKQLDHLCRNRACVNPAHLEPVTRKENILRGVCPTAVNARKTHCPHGHPLSGDNLRIKRRSQGRPGKMRLCRECGRLADLRRRAGGPGRTGRPKNKVCLRGHLMEGENVAYGGGRRRCRACARFHYHARRASGH